MRGSFLLTAAACLALAFAEDEQIELTGDDGLGELLEDFVVAPATTYVNGVLELDDDNFNVTVASTDNILVQFWAPWCNTCKTIRSEYERAAGIAKNLSIPVTLARIDGNKYTETAERLEIKNLPTFVLYRKFGSEAAEFPTLTTGEAYAAGLDKLLDLGLDVSPVKNFVETSEEVAAWLFWRGTSDGKLQTTALLYQGPDVAPENADANNALAKAFDATAKELMRFSNLRFAACRQRSVLEDFEIPLDRNTLVIYKDHDEGRVVYDGPADPAAIKDWVLRQDTPLVTDIWHRTLQGFRRRVKTLALFFVSEQQSEHYPTMARLKASLNEVAYKLEKAGFFNRGEFTIGIADGKKYASWVKHFKLPVGAFPSMSVENTETGAFYSAPDFREEASSSLPTGDSARGYRLAKFLVDKRKKEQEQASVSVDAAGNTVAAPAATPAIITSANGFEHVAPADEGAIEWVDAPVDTLTRYFESYFAGAFEPVGHDEAKAKPAQGWSK